MTAHGGRPHWGKVHTRDAEYFAGGLSALRRVHRAARPARPGPAVRQRLPAAGAGRLTPATPRPPRCFEGAERLSAVRRSLGAGAVGRRGLLALAGGAARAGAVVGSAPVAPPSGATGSASARAWSRRRRSRRASAWGWTRCPASRRPCPYRGPGSLPPSPGSVAGAEPVPVPSRRLAWPGFRLPRPGRSPRRAPGRPGRSRGRRHRRVRRTQSGAVAAAEVVPEISLVGGDPGDRRRRRRRRRRPPGRFQPRSRVPWVVPSVNSPVTGPRTAIGPGRAGAPSTPARGTGVVSLVCTVTWRPSGWVTWTVTSRICSPVRRKKCWKTEPPQVATTLITPAPRMVPYTPSCEASHGCRDGRHGAPGDLRHDSDLCAFPWVLCHFPASEPFTSPCLTSLPPCNRKGHMSEADSSVSGDSVKQNTHQGHSRRTG